MLVSLSNDSPLRATFPNRLAAPQPERPALGARPWLLTGLVLLCLLPRAFMAAKVASVCPDGVLYVRVAEAKGEDATVEGLEHYYLNTFTSVLLALHRAGLDWELAGKLWGVTLSSLVVLPLYGWVRRQFDDQVALAACLLYAVHKEFIVWSPELMREPTYWLFFVLSIYLLWRALTEVRLRWFAAAGAGMALAAATRFEGFFLFIPLVLWGFWRFLALAEGRARLMAGAALCVTVFLAVPVVSALLPGPWDIGFCGQSASGYVRTWLRGGPPASVARTEAPLAVSAGPSHAIGWGRAVQVFVPTVVKAYTPVVGLCMLTGLAGWWKLWLRRDHHASGVVALVTLAAIWIHLWAIGASCTRFVLPVVLLSLPCVALGVARWAEWLLRWGAAAPRRWRTVLAALPWAMVTVAGLSSSLGSDYSRRRGEANLGHWLQNGSGPAPLVFGSEGIVPVVNYYARGRSAVFPFYADDDWIVASVRRLNPDFVLFNVTKRMTVARCRALSRSLAPLGFRPVDPSEMPADCEKMVLLVRK